MKNYITLLATFVLSILGFAVQAYGDCEGTVPTQYSVGEGCATNDSGSGPIASVKYYGTVGNKHGYCGGITYNGTTCAPNGTVTINPYTISWSAGHCTGTVILGPTYYQAFQLDAVKTVPCESGEDPDPSE